jgi:hypothetical protein
MTDGLLVKENARKGSLSWLPQRLSFTPASKPGEFLGTEGAQWRDSGRSTAIEGWCSESSVNAGDILRVHVSTNPATDFTLDVYRMGFYGGLGARQVASYSALRGVPQPGPEERAGRLIECEWEPSHEITIPEDWVSGVYLGKLTRADNAVESYVIFVVRDHRGADLIAQTSDFTWQAYNHWPNAFSLYSNGADNRTQYYGTDVAVSLDRPYLSTTYFSAPLHGTGEYFVFEYPFTYWLEREGYDVTYCSDLDTHRGTADFTRAKGFLSIGHDEYVTRAMYDNLLDAIDSGLNVGFFCGNSYCFSVDLRPGTTGRPDRVFSRKDVFGGQARRVERMAGDDRAAAEIREFAAKFPFPLEEPDDGALMGSRNGWPGEGVGHWVCSLPDHWVFEGTGMRVGDSIPNLVGHEWHGNPAEVPGLEVVSTGPTLDSLMGPGEYVATVHPGPRGNTIFNASTTWWSSGLALPPGYQRPTWNGLPSALPDARAQQITHNVLGRFMSS